MISAMAFYDAAFRLEKVPAIRGIMEKYAHTKVISFIRNIDI